MSEVITTIHPSEPPEGYDKLDKIEITKQADNSERLYGVINLAGAERKVQLPDLAQAWGYDPEDRERYNADPEKWELYNRLASLERQVAVLTGRNNLLESRLADKGSIAPGESTPLSAEDIPDGEPQAVTREPDLSRGDQVAVRHNGKYKPGYVVVGFPLENGQARIAIKDESNQKEYVVSPDAVERVSELDPAELWRAGTAESKPGLRKGWNRAAGRLGAFVVGNHARLYNSLYNRTGESGGTVVVEEKIIDGYSERDVAVGEAVTGTAAAGLLLGGLIGYLIWGRHGASPPQIINHYQEHKVYVPTGGNHIDYLKPDGASAVGLPMKLRVARDALGHDVIKNSLGQTVVGHSEVPKGFQDEQGNLSRAARAVLRAKGFILTQTHVPRSGRYMTAVWDR